MATERAYFLRRAAGEPWRQVTEKMYVSAVLSTDPPLRKYCPDGAAVAVVEAAQKCPLCGDEMQAYGAYLSCRKCNHWAGV
jgi:hypothetical protein